MAAQRRRRGWSLTGRDSDSTPLDGVTTPSSMTSDREAEPLTIAEAEERTQREAEESLIAALQESDTTVDVLHDQSRTPGRRRSHWAVGLAGLMLAAAAILVARRRSW